MMQLDRGRGSQNARVKLITVQMCLHKILLQKIVENLKEVMGFIKNKSRIK